MKSLFSFLIFFAFFTNVVGQIIITNQDIAPAGTTIYDSYDTIPAGNIVPGDAGPNQVWAFSNLNQHGIDTIYYLMPDWTPWASDFPDANFAAESTEEDGTSFFIRNDDEISNIGLVTDNIDYGLMLLDVQPGEIFLDFPVQYGDTREEDFFFSEYMESTIPGVDSVRIKRSTHKITNVDAYGTIMLDIGTYDALRIKEDRTIEDSTWIKVFITGWTLFETTTSVTQTYSWLTNDVTVGYSLFSMDIDPETSIVTKASYLMELPTGITVNTPNKTVIFPNPTSGIFYVKLENEISGHFILYDNRGKVVINKSISYDSNLLTIYLNEIPSGMYYYKIIEQQSSKTWKSGKIIVN